MHWLRSFILAGNLSLWLALAPIAAFAARAADGTQDPQVQRTEQEVEKLRRELQRKEDELRQLKEKNREQEKRQEEELRELKKENQKLRQQKTPPPAQVIVKTDKPAKPVLPLAGLPPLTPQTVVEATDLVGQFAADPEAAATRYERQRFRVKGEIAHFSRTLLVRDYEIMLDGGVGKEVACKFNYINASYRAVYTADRGRRLVASYGANSTTVLATLGETVTIDGRCKRAKDGELILTECEIVH